MSELERNEFHTREQLDCALAQHVSELLIEAIAARGKATLVVSGGTTPVGFFKLLSKQVLDWKRVIVTLADERWVDADHDASNEWFVGKNLLINNASKASFIPLITGHVSPYDAEQALNSLLDKIGTIDVLVLGMGVDGHTASLFPNTLSLKEGININSKQSFIGVMPLVAPHQRISMTLARLLNSRKIIFHITGVEKRVVFEKACAEFNPQILPISALLHQAITPVALYWSE